MPQIKENFLKNILFQFESYSCDCVTDLEHIAPGEEPIRKYKLQALHEPKLLFAYAAKKGLVRIAPNGTIEEANVLGTIMALSNKSVKELSSFMEKNGFLFPVSTGSYEEIDANTLYSIMERLRMTVELMTAANETHKDYQKILLLTINLLFAEDLTIKTDAMTQAYTTKHRSYIDLLQSPKINVSYEREHEAFNSDFYTVTDTIYGSYQLSIQEYNDIVGGYSAKSGFNDLLFRNITVLYLNLESSGIEKNITDLLFHYFHEVGMLNFSNGLAYYEDPNLDAFTKEMKKSLVEIARHIIGEEINANLDGIHPVYNADTMAPSWKVDNLLCALYFSIFYLKPDLELYRPCDNPNCGKYFLVKTTSTKTRYCSTECCNRVTQARYRKKRREREEASAQ
ncbi:MAG: CGNR zinc finger domain-containing protein [Breznakia sp.]